MQAIDRIHTQSRNTQNPQKSKKKSVLGTWIQYFCVSEPLSNEITVQFNDKYVSLEYAVRVQRG